MENTISKKYFLVRNDNNVIIDITFANSKGTCSTSHTFSQSDSLQDCVNEFLNNGVNNFSVPVNVERLEDVPSYYTISEYSDNILTKYIDGEPVYEDTILTSFIEMSEDEKQNQGLINKVAFLKWQQVEKNNEVKFIKRFHFRLEDVFSDGLLASKFNEMVAKQRPFYNVDANHNLDEDGEWVDLYLEQINPQDITDINNYLSAIVGSKLEDFNDL